MKKYETFANNVPPVNLCVQDLGQTGPIIGTVHASKGRQAENVQLFMSSGQRPDASAEAIAEKSRILLLGQAEPKIILFQVRFLAIRQKYSVAPRLSTKQKV